MSESSHESLAPITPDDLQSIAAGFSSAAAIYDSFAIDHPHLTRLRDIVYAHIARFVLPGANILELNCGSGTDAIRLAKMGYRVHATDIAEGMLERLADKAAKAGTKELLTWQRGSFLELDKMHGGRYDVVFSNLGGLNCISDLRWVTRQLSVVLKPGGLVIWVLMPKICLWELATAFTGQFRLAFRRLKQGGTPAHLEGQVFPVYYFNPTQAIAAFGPDYSPLALNGLSVFTPTAESKGLIRRWPRIYSILAWLDDRLAHRWPWHSWGDFFILTMRYRPE